MTPRQKPSNTRTSSDVGIGDERRREILAAAARLFDERGYNNASMADVADAVGLAKPTLYYYFSGKEAILYALGQTFVVPLIERQLERAARGGSPSEQLHEIIEDLLSMAAEYPGHMKVLFEHERELPAKLKREVKAQRQVYQEQVEAVLDAGVADGSFRAVDTPLASFGILGMCNWSYKWLRSDGRASPKQIATLFFDLIMDGLSANRA